MDVSSRSKRTWYAEPPATARLPEARGSAGVPDTWRLAESVPRTGRSRRPATSSACSMGSLSTATVALVA